MVFQSLLHDFSIQSTQYPIYAANTSCSSEVSDEHFGAISFHFICIAQEHEDVDRLL